MLYFLYFILGSIFGSFLNVLIYRVPNNLSIAFPRSFCPHCKNTIPFYRNIPIFSFLIQFGKCADCNKRISLSYPIAEFLTGLIFVVGMGSFNLPESITFILISSFLLTISIIDYKYYIIPFQISLAILSILIPYTVFFSNIIYHVYGMLIGISYLLLIFILTWIVTKKQPIGFGDIQLIILLGLWLGPMKILLTIFLAACLGILYWLILSLMYGYTKNRKLPFGTFLSISSIVVYLIRLNWDLFLGY